MNGREPAGDVARGLTFDSSQLVLPAIQFDAGNFSGLAIFGDGDVLLGEEVQQVLLGVGAVPGPADDSDHVVQVIERDLVADQNVLAFARLAQVVAGAAQHHIAAMLDEQADKFEQPHLFGLAAGDGQQYHAERFLHLGVLVEIVQNELRFFAALELDDNAHALAVTLVAHVGDAINLFVLRQFRDALDERGLVHLVRNLGDDYVLAVLGNFFNRGFGAHREAAAPGFVGCFDAFAAGDIAAGREIRPGHELHHFLERCVRPLDHQHGGVNDFAEVMRRNIGGHAHGDAARPVD